MTKQKVDAPDAENPQWTKQDIASAVPLSALPASMQRVLANRTRGPQKAPKKVAISMRLAPDLVAALRASGDGWQGRAEGALRAWLTSEKAAGGRGSH
jgi:uncharacterized protein (DUF4415 family)